MRHRIAHLAFAAVTTLSAAAAAAQTIVDDWASIKAPPPPELKPVSIDAKTTALLMLDFVTPNCSSRPRCMAQLPAVKKALEMARARGMLVAFATGPTGKRADTLPEVFPRDSEPVVSTGVDKFMNTDLEKILKERGVQTVIAIGTAAQGAVLYTASGASLRGMKVIVPVDGMSSDAPYSEQYTAWHLANAPVVSKNVTLTKFDLLQF
ncbi:cysteine hydrolase family protein [Azospira restricta]|uniref:Isochorismatase family protein n=1 Tax=Azospira restricta TaxID=404405 RepID=A0A974Y3V7_9RHOO|nr:isochorismatase family protein [Azospira restricta]QRJ64110.1 isochorismatase family protein [Azospira restricta]